jgi:type IV pilus assembly protein PilW
MNRKHHNGFTLVEMMIAVTLSLILMAGVFKVMNSSKQTYALQSELATLQENARFVMDDISYNIRMAGYYGFSTANPSEGDVPPGINLAAFQCPNNKCDDNFPDSDSLTLTAFGQDGKLELRQYDKDIPEGNPNGIAIPDNFDGLSESDAKSILLGVKKVNLGQLGIVGSGKNFYLKEGSPLPQQTVDGKANYLVISNFARARFYEIGAIDAANYRITLGNIYGTVNDESSAGFTWPVEVFDSSKIKTTHYEMVKINTAGTTDTFQCPVNSAPCYILFKCANAPCTANEKNRNKPEYALLMEGVENIQIRYGIDTDGDEIVNTFASNPTAIATAKVVSVRVNLLMRTVSRRFDTAETTDRVFDLDTGLSYTADDNSAPNVSAANVYNPAKENEQEEKGFRHRLFTSTVKVRN